MKIKHFVIFSIAMVLIYTITELIMSCWGFNHETLTTCFFACFGGELLCACVLKIFEDKKNDNDINIGGNSSDICD